jgi:phospholipase/carboxylesterase
LPVFIAHGTQDETVPVAAARQAREVYTRLGAQVTYGEYPTGHKLTTQAMADLKQWLAQVIGPGS